MTGVAHPLAKFTFGPCLSFLGDPATIPVTPAVGKVRDVTAFSFFTETAVKASGAWEMLVAFRPPSLWVRARAHPCVYNNVHSYLGIRACVCFSSPGTWSVLTQKLCLHFHFSSPAGLSPNLPWQLLSTRQTYPAPPHPLSYAASPRPRC